MKLLKYQFENCKFRNLRKLLLLHLRHILMSNLLFQFFQVERLQIEQFFAFGTKSDETIHHRMQLTQIFLKFIAY